MVVIVVTADIRIRDISPLHHEGRIQYKQEQQNEENATEPHLLLAMRYSASNTHNRGLR